MNKHTASTGSYNSHILPRTDGEGHVVQDSLRGVGVAEAHVPGVEKREIGCKDIKYVQEYSMHTSRRKGANRYHVYDKYIEQNTAYNYGTII